MRLVVVWGGCLVEEREKTKEVCRKLHNGCGIKSIRPLDPDVAAWLDAFASVGCTLRTSTFGFMNFECSATCTQLKINRLISLLRIDHRLLQWRKMTLWRSMMLPKLEHRSKRRKVPERSE